MSQTAEKPADMGAEINEMNFETALAELEKIVARLESGRGELEDSIKIYERGVALRKHCEAKLKTAEARIEKISLDAAGNVTSQPLDG